MSVKTRSEEKSIVIWESEQSKEGEATVREIRTDADSGIGSDVTPGGGMESGGGFGIGEEPVTHRDLANGTVPLMPVIRIVSSGFGGSVYTEVQRTFIVISSHTASRALTGRSMGHNNLCCAA